MAPETFTLEEQLAASVAIANARKANGHAAEVPETPAPKRRKSTETQALVMVPSAIEVERQRFMPVMDMAVAIERRMVIKKAITELMVEGEDYGAIPGVGTTDRPGKPTLLQPGAQKLDNLFGLVPRFEVVDKVEDWTGSEHAGEPFFRYMIRCTLNRGEFAMGEGMGECNSWEAKYRWRTSERKCPACASASVIKGKDEYGGGWLCFKKKGGCGAKYADGDSRIEGQTAGRIPNPDIFDQVNTLLKMASKRGHVAATINTTSASEFFTQDLELEMPRTEQDQEPGTEDMATKGRPPKQPRTQRPPRPQYTPPQVAVLEQKLQAQTPTVSGAEPAHPEASNVVVPPKKPWRTYGEMKVCFASVRERLGEVVYLKVLNRFGKAHATEFRSTSEAEACYAELMALDGKVA